MQIPSFLLCEKQCCFCLHLLIHFNIPDLGVNLLAAPLNWLYQLTSVQRKFRELRLIGIFH